MDNSNKEILALSETSLDYLKDMSKWALIIGGINLLISTVIFYFAVFFGYCKFGIIGLNIE